MRHTHAVARSRGFTLIELIAVVVLMGIMAAVGSTMIVDTFKSTRLANNSQAAASEARYAMERVAREIRETGYTGSAYQIATMNAAQIVLTKSDGAVVTINHSGSNLTIAYSTLADVTATLSNKVAVNGLTLTYYDIDGAATTSNADVRFVEIELVIADATTGFTTTQRSRVGLRNS